MRLVILSDIHGNLPALELVMKEVAKQSPDKIICLGDLVGYGPQPNECVEIIRESNIPTVLGNHDGALVGKVPIAMFREPNATLLKWSMNELTEENKSFLNSIPYTMTEDNWIAAHAHPENPESWKYLESAIDCRKLLATFPDEVDFCFVGHTHKPVLVPGELGVFGLQKGNKYVINPGSVGQSRDNDGRASFCVLDTEKFEHEFIRVDYPQALTIAGYDKTPLTREQGEYLMRIRSNKSR